MPQVGFKFLRIRSNNSSWVDRKSLRWNDRPRRRRMTWLSLLYVHVDHSRKDFSCWGHTYTWSTISLKHVTVTSHQGQIKALFGSGNFLNCFAILEFHDRFLFCRLLYMLVPASPDVHIQRTTEYQDNKKDRRTSLRLSGAWWVLKLWFMSSSIGISSSSY
jgi:hypothetical protein